MSELVVFQGAKCLFEKDMPFVVLPYFSEDYISKIKQAVPCEALIFRNCVPMPLMVKVEESVPAPDSKNCDASKEWYKYITQNQ